MLQITPLPAFDDNYIWLLTHPGSKDAVVVDPGDDQPVVHALKPLGLRLAAILVTHHHWDHAGGVEALRQRYLGCRVYGPEDPRIHGITDPVREGDRIRPAGLEVEFLVMDVPGHTSTHVAFQGGDVLFCGDTLFAAGCGRVFDGTFDQLAASLERIGGLPPVTRVYCAHEYTLANLGFARWVEPENPAILEREEQDGHRRKGGHPTVPSSLELELATNPFLRTDRPEVIAAAERYVGRPLKTRAEVFRALRQWKDREYD